jgi:hypothetical protein
MTLAAEVCERGVGERGLLCRRTPSQPNSHAELVNWPGNSLVGQKGVLVAPNGGMIAVTLAAPPDSGKFDDGTTDLTTMAGWLNTNLEALPAGQCSL